MSKFNFTKMTILISFIPLVSCAVLAKKDAGSVSGPVDLAIQDALLVAGPSIGLNRSVDAQSVSGETPSSITVVVEDTGAMDDSVYGQSVTIKYDINNETSVERRTVERLNICRRGGGKPLKPAGPCL